MSFTSQRCWQRRDVAHGSVFSGRLARTIPIGSFLSHLTGIGLPSPASRDGQEGCVFMVRLTSLCYLMANWALNGLKRYDRLQCHMWCEKGTLLKIKLLKLHRIFCVAGNLTWNVKKKKIGRRDRSFKITIVLVVVVLGFFSSLKSPFSLSVERLSSSVMVILSLKQRGRLFSFPAAQFPSRRDGWVLACTDSRSAASGRCKEPE